MLKLILIGLAGLSGTLFRYGLSQWAGRQFGESSTAGTLLVNLAGCFLAGLLFFLLFEKYPSGQTLRAWVFVGLLGGFTTFSAYGLQTFALLREGRFGLAAVNVAVSNLGGLLMVWLGYTLAKTF